MTDWEQRCIEAEAMAERLMEERDIYRMASGRHLTSEEHDRLDELAAETRGESASTEEVEVGPLDEPSMEDYPDRDDFGAPPVKVVKVRDGVRDTRSR